MAETQVMDTVTLPADPYGILPIFATHLELSLQHSHPEQATKAAYAAVDSYLKSHAFVNTSSKDSEGPAWRMVRKREGGGDAMR